MGTARDSLLIGKDALAVEYGETFVPVNARESQERTACVRAKEALAKPLAAVAAKWERGRVANECEGKCPVCKKVRAMETVAGSVREATGSVEKRGRGVVAALRWGLRFVSERVLFFVGWMSVFVEVEVKDDGVFLLSQ